MEDILFSLKIEQFLKLLFTYQFLQIYHFIIFGCVWLIIFLFEVVYIFLNYVNLCYIFFSVQLNSLNFKYIIQIYHFLKDIIMIIFGLKWNDPLKLIN